MAYRIVDQLVTYFDNAGVVLADGSLTFSLTGTATPATVYLDPDLSDEAANPLGLDSAGRPDTDVWSDEVLRVVMKNSAGTVIRTIDDVQAPTSSANQLPAFEAGKYLTNDGALASWESVSQVPDATGSEGRILTVVGGVAAWAEPAAGYDADNLPGGLLDESNYVQIGNTMIMRGSGTAATNGSNNVTASVSFSPAFDTAPVLTVTPTIGSINNSGWTASPAGVSKSAAGFTANFWADGEHGGTSTTIDSAVTFDWIAIGTRVP
jgi:hypothetical protein